NTDYIKIPRPAGFVRPNRGDEGNAVAQFPLKPIHQRAPGNGAVARFQKRLLLLFWQGVVGIDFEKRFEFEGKIAEEVFRLAFIDAMEPRKVCYRIHARNV